MNRIGIIGMTVTRILSCGTQKGHTEDDRGLRWRKLTSYPRLGADVQ